MIELPGIDPKDLPKLENVEEKYQHLPVLGNTEFREAVYWVNQQLDTPLPPNLLDEEFDLSTDGNFEGLQYLLLQELGLSKNKDLSETFFKSLSANAAAQLVFSLPSIIDLPTSRCVTNIDHVFQKHPGTRIMDQLPRRRWSSSVSMYNNLINPAPLGSLGLQVTIDMVKLDNLEEPRFEKKGHAHYTPSLFLDAPWTYLVHNRQGRHLLTLGFCLNEKGVFVNQIQSPSKNKNRELMKVPLGYVEYFMQFLNRTFPDHTLALRRGSVVMEDLLDTWEKTKVSMKKRSQKLDEEKERLATEYCNHKITLIRTIGPRITGLYDQPFTRFLPIPAEDKRYRRLLPEAITYSY